MQKSEHINELAAAMAKAQGVIENAAKDAANPYFRSKYADLASCWDACRKGLSSNGLAVLQPVRVDGATVTVTTLLAHSSGQWISEDLSMTSKRQLKDGGGWEIVDNPQGLGSTITYARRYALCAMAGIAPDDDDGNDGSGRGSQAAADAIAARKIAEHKGTAVQVPEEMRPLYASLRKGPEGIKAAWDQMATLMGKAGDDAAEYFDNLVAKFWEKYKGNAPIEKHEGAMLDLYEALEAFRKGPSEG